MAGTGGGDDSKKILLPPHTGKGGEPGSLAGATGGANAPPRATLRRRGVTLTSAGDHG